MKSVTRFQRWVLIPLEVTFILLALMYFIRADWFGGIAALAVSLVMGMISQSLHKKKTALQISRGEHPDPDDSNPASISETESLLLTTGLAYSTLTLTIAVMVLSVYHEEKRWWMVAVSGIGVGIFYLLLCKIVVQLVPFLFSRKNRSKGVPLPGTIACPHCSATLSLDEEERRTKRFVCPGCGSQIDMR